MPNFSCAQQLVLIGDTEQLAEIDAGGAFRALVAQQTGVELTEVTRQQDPAARAQLEAIRQGQAAEALEAMRDDGNLVLCPTAEHARVTIVADWLAGHRGAAEDGPAFMVAKRNQDVRDLNHRARDPLIDRGLLGDDAVVLGGCELREGERVIAGVNDRRVGVRNGTTGTLQRIDRERRVLHVRSDRGVELQLPFDYAQGRTRTGRPHLDYAYAVTVHRAQGETWGRVYYLGGEDSYRQETYTALSRARHGHRFYATAPDLTEVATQPALDSLEPLVRAVGRDQAKTLALDALNDPALRRLTDQELQHDVEALRARAGRHAAMATALDRLDRQRAASSDPADQVGVDRQRAELLAHRGRPDSYHRHLARYAAAELEHARRRAPDRQLALHRAISDPPVHITDAIGAPPPDPAGRETWNRAARVIERYRHDHAPHLTPERPGLGPHPDAPPERRYWQQTGREL